MSRVRVYLAQSLDGFIAGPDHDLGWLPTTVSDDDFREAGALGFADFIAEIGAMVMGRRTYDVVESFAGEWPYGDLPIVVATHRPMDAPVGTVAAAEGSLNDILATAREFAGDGDIYLDGGVLVRDGLEAGVVDELVVTIIPVILGEGIRFSNVAERVGLELKAVSRPVQGMVQMTYIPVAISN